MMKNTGKELENLFNDLEKNAYNIDHYYEFKEANQIIRKHFERILSAVKKTKK